MRLDSAGRDPPPTRARGIRGRVAGCCGARRDIESDTREEEALKAERRRRIEDCEKVEAIKGAQQSGTGRGFGAAKGNKERGRRRWLAERSSAAVVKVMAKATANLSWRAV